MVPEPSHPFAPLRIPSHPFASLRIPSQVHEPLEVPERYVAPFAAIGDDSRRLYAGMLAALDEGIGNITSSLRAASLEARSVLVLSNDNGGMSGTYGMGCCHCGTSCGGLNFPYRGWKDSYWEGGFRGIGFVYAPGMLRPAASYTAYAPLLWVGDWYATLLSAALHGASEEEQSAARLLLAPLLKAGPIDSIDAWASLLDAANGRAAGNPLDTAPRTDVRSEVLLAGIDIDKQGAALRVGKYKLLVGAWGSSTWCDLNVSGHSPAYPAPPAAEGLGGEGGLFCMQLPTPPPPPPATPRPRLGAMAPPPPPWWAPPPPPWWERVAGLYDVVADPRERTDLQLALPGIVSELLQKLVAFNQTVAPSIHEPTDPAGKEHANETGCLGPWQLAGDVPL